MSEKYICLFGGRSTEHDASLHSFSSCLESIRESPDHVARLGGALFSNREGRLFWWDAVALLEGTALDYENGVAVSWSDFLTQAKDNDYFVFNLLHGNEGEDGGIQGLAQITDLPGSFGSVFAASFTMSKWAQAYSIAAFSGGQLKAPATWIVDRHTTEDEIRDIVAGIQGPFIVKPNSLGASLFTERLDHSDESAVMDLIRTILRYDRQALIQEFISGEEYTCGCIRDGESCEVLRVIKASTERSFLGHAEKHRKGMVQVSSLELDDVMQQRIGSISEKLFQRMDLADMARFDYIYHAEEDALYFLECNSIPGLGHSSAYPRMLRQSGYSLTDLIDRCISNFRIRVPSLKKYAYVIQ